MQLDRHRMKKELKASGIDSAKARKQRERAYYESLIKQGLSKKEAKEKVKQLTDGTLRLKYPLGYVDPDREKPKPPKPPQSPLLAILPKKEDVNN